MATPYTTASGLQIGCMYSGHRPPHHDKDALKLQSALTGRAEPNDTDGITIVLVCGVLLACLVVAKWMGVFA